MDNGRIRKKFLGSLLGAAIGDALGASWEGHPMVAEYSAELLTSVSYPLRYTDDTHMTIGVAESLVACGGFDGAHKAGRFVSKY
jgi:poly(ADP-ribose) glycohydrolase ARH3